MDLRSSRAKLSRAVRQLQTLDAELRASVHSAKPYAIRADMNEHTGWLSLSIEPDPADLEWAVIVGEIIHNLRSSLDYSVSALLEASSVALTLQHQFPLFDTLDRFRNKVGDATRPKGPLAGLKLGFAEIEAVQPFQVKPDPQHAALALLQRLSNSDKHRSIVIFAPFPQSHKLQLRHNGAVVDQWQPDPIVWEPAGATEFQRVRFAPPYPTYLAPQADLVLELGFLDRPFPPTYPSAAHFGLTELHAISQQVDIVLRSVEAL